MPQIVFLETRCNKFKSHIFFFQYKTSFTSSGQTELKRPLCLYSVTFLHEIGPLSLLSGSCKHIFSCLHYPVPFACAHVPTLSLCRCVLAVTSLICLSSQVVVHTRMGERLYRISPWAKYVTRHEKSVIYDWVHWDPPQPYIVSDYFPPAPVCHNLLFCSEL